MRFFLECGFAQKILSTVLAGKGAVCLVAKFGFVFFFGRSHSASRNFGPESAIQPSLETATDRVGQSRRRLAKIDKFLFPTPRVALFRFGHAQKNAFSLFVFLASRQFAIDLRRFHLGAPISLNNLDCFLSILPAVRLGLVGLHRAQSAATISAARAGSVLDLICCAVITTATDPIINPAPINVRKVRCSPAKNVPSKMATIGLM